MTSAPLKDHVALVAGATRGAGRGIAVELGAAGATVYVTGRTTRAARSPMNRPETIEETAELVTAAGGRGVAVQVDHARPAEVSALVERIAAEQDGRLDVLVNDIWGGDPLTQWGVPFYEHSLEDGLALLHQAVDTHIVTSHHAVPLMVRRGSGLVVEVTDGASDDYRGSLFYDLAKASVIRLARAQAADLAGHGVTAVALTPGFLRSEAVLDHFGVTAESWRDAIARDRHFAASETPRYVGRAVAALAADPGVARFAGQALSSWQLAAEYGFTDVDGSRPDWGGTSPCTSWVGEAGAHWVRCSPMSAGLAALLDDVAALTRAAAASVDDVAAGASRASMKAAGVIVDDAAVTPRYVTGFTPDRELPMIRRIAVGSLRNKLLFILPAALLLSELLPWLLTPILMIGGTYLCYEGAEKLWEMISPHHAHAEAEGGEQQPGQEDELVGGAIRTDFILSAEIMVISLNEVTDQPLLSRTLILIVVALAITALVYGAVALIVKMDDVGLNLARTREGAVAAFGRGLVRSMPIVLSVLSKVGIAAMLWVGGHILLVGLDELGVHFLYDAVHHLEEDVKKALGGVGGVAAWLVNTGASAILGVLVGAVVVAALHLRKGKAAH